MLTRTCSLCKETKLLTTGFYLTQRNGRPQYMGWCKSCRCAKYHERRARDPHHYTKLAMRRRHAKAEMAGNIKQQRGCVDCGYNAHPAALDWHHRDPKDKSVGIAILLGHNTKWSKIEAEMEKCEVLCANCHRIRHANKRAAEKAARSA